MSLLFKIQKTLVTFSLALILEKRIIDIKKLSRKTKGYLIKLLRNAEGSEKWKFKCVLFDRLHVHEPWTWKKKDKVQVPQLNEMLSFHLVLLVKMNNVIPKKIYLMIGIYLKNLILQKVVHNRK